METVFSSIGKRKVPYSKINLSHGKQLSFQIGQLIPLSVIEAVPGDSVNMNAEVQIRLAPLVNPAYAHLKVKTEWFFAPSRLLMKQFPEVRKGTDENGDPSVPVVPYFPSLAGNIACYVGTLWDYMGLPIASSVAPMVWTPKVSVLPFRAITKIWNDWYRAPNVQDEALVRDTSGVIGIDEVASLLEMKTRNWSRDYFTAAMPTAQQGSPASAPIDVVYSQPAKLVRPGGAGPGVGAVAGQVTTGNVYAGSDSVAVENISTASVLAESIRLAEKIQRFLEAMQRGGNRYVDFLYSIFGQQVQDSRLQRTEFIGGSTGSIQISEVLSTVQFEGTADDLPQGNMSGHGYHMSKGNRCSYRAPEDGYFICLLSVVPEGRAYGNGQFSGIHKMFQRFSRYDFYIPDFANLGEQPVLNSELATNPSEPTNEPASKGIFGYVPRYSEYKWMPSTVHGDFRTSLDSWTLARGFVPLGTGAVPALNSDFVSVRHSGQDLDRIFAVTDGAVDKLWCNVWIDFSAMRPMPYDPIPGI